MLDGLEKVIQRGENLENLEKKTAEIRSTGNSLHKKTKKLNKGWFACLGCDNDETYSRGSVAYQGAKIATSKKTGDFAHL